MASGLDQKVGAIDLSAWDQSLGPLCDTLCGAIQVPLDYLCRQAALRFPGQPAREKVGTSDEGSPALWGRTPSPHDTRNTSPSCFSERVYTLIREVLFLCHSMDKEAGQLLSPKILGVFTCIWPLGLR